MPPHSLLLVDLLRHDAHHYATQTALRLDGAALTYAELARRVEATAARWMIASGPQRIACSTEAESVISSGTTSTAPSGATADQSA